MTDQPRLNPVDISVVEEYVTPEGYVVDFNRIKQSEFQTFLDEVKAPENVNKWMARVIVKMPFPGDPTDAQTYGDMGIIDYARVKGVWEKIFFRDAGPLVTAAPSPNGGAAVG